MADKSGQRPTSRANLFHFTGRSGQFKVAVDAGITVPTDGVGGYDPGCLFIQTDSATPMEDGWYINVGSATSCNFDAIDLSAITGTIAFDSGTAVPTGAGYDKGTLFVHTDGTSPQGTLYVNIGTSTVANFDAVQFIEDPAGTATGRIVSSASTAPTTGSGYSVGGLIHDNDVTANSIAGVSNSWLQNFGGSTTADCEVVQFVRCENGAEGVIFHAADTPPSTGAGFEVGGLSLDTDITANTPADISGAWRMNYGGSTTASFDDVQFVRNSSTLTSAGQLFGGGETTPADSTAGWATNALFIQASGATSTTRLFINQGGPVTSNFDAVTLTIA